MCISPEIFICVSIGVERQRGCVYPGLWLRQPNKKPEKGKGIDCECTRVILMMDHEIEA